MVSKHLRYFFFTIGYIRVFSNQGNYIGALNILDSISLEKLLEDVWVYP